MTFEELRQFVSGTKIPERDKLAKLARYMRLSDD